ncbi:HesA/MoeB/ThiF family protein [Candidatus Woesearchaeota archaeon]|nr:HesA/MoeB/ThiF family protein [Candidatus Woesearchaeota archaeon]
MHSRQEAVWGKEAHHKIKNSIVAVLGLGGLGTVATELLVRAGVEKLIIIDRDVVEESNLSRQILYAAADIGRSKAMAAKERLNTINPGAIIAAEAIHFDAGNCTTLETAEIVLDCTDNLQTRLVLNDYCRKNNKKWIYGAAIKTVGYVMPIFPEGPCVRCFLKEVQLETCEMVGVLNTVTSSIAALQVQIALELLVGKNVPSYLYQYDVDAKSFQTLTVRRNLECPACAGTFEYLIPKAESKVIAFCSSGRYEVWGRMKNLHRIKEQWAGIDHVQDDGTTMRFKNILLFADGRALIKANSEEEALSAYSRWIGN